jgi:hypothetical protein
LWLGESDLEDVDNDRLPVIILIRVDWKEVALVVLDVIRGRDVRKVEQKLRAKVRSTSTDVIITGMSED